MAANLTKPKGRTTRLTPEIERQVILAISAGAPLKVAAGSAGIGVSTLGLWLQKGQEGRQPYLGFMERVRDAQDRIHTRIVGTITTAALTNWTAAIAWIRLRWPEQYAERLEVTGAGGSPLMAGNMIANIVVQVIEGMGLEEAKVILAKRLIAEEMRKVAMTEDAPVLIDR